MPEHVFISYSRKNPNLRDKLINVLNNEGFACWCDMNDISGGEEWRMALDQAIDEASVMVVIVTKQSMKSHYVTYEWARAIGNGIEVVPLLFEDLPNNVNSKNPLPDRKQWIDCRTQIVANQIAKALNQAQNIPSRIMHLKSLISKTILRLRILTRTALWLYPYTKPNNIPIHEELFRPLIERASSEAREVCYPQLLDLVTSKSHAFTRKLYKECDDLVDQSKILVDKLGHLAVVSQLFHEDHSSLVREVEQFRLEEWERAIQRTILPIHDSRFEEVEEYIEVLQTRRPIESPTSTFNVGLQSLKDDGELIRKALYTVRDHLYPTD
jgi:hypothetical protein